MAQGLLLIVAELEETMIRGIYMNSSAMQYLEEKMDVVANNLANSDTSGFKRNGMFINQLMGAEQANIRNEIKQPLPAGELKTYTEYTQAGIRDTQNKFDLAINGDGFFTIETSDGLAYTRDGRFVMGPDGILSTINGYHVMGESGAINLEGEKFSVTEDGEIVINNQIVDKLSINSFDIKEAVQMGDNLWKTKNDDVEVYPTNPEIKQGYLEISNVSIVKEMVSMIAIQRWYNANEKAIKTNDDALNKAVNNIAK
jgi:flagellar basal-body rod protein FlgG